MLAKREWVPREWVPGERWSAHLRCESSCSVGDCVLPPGAAAVWVNTQLRPQSLSQPSVLQRALIKQLLYSCEKLADRPGTRLIYSDLVIAVWKF